jgi:hypothetical protein
MQEYQTGALVEQELPEIPSSSNDAKRPVKLED